MRAGRVALAIAPRWSLRSARPAVPMTTGRLRIDTGASETVTELVIGRSYARMAPVEPNVIDTTPCELTFLEIEMKR